MIKICIRFGIWNRQISILAVGNGTAGTAGTAGADGYGDTDTTFYVGQQTAIVLGLRCGDQTSR